MQNQKNNTPQVSVLCTSQWRLCTVFDQYLEKSIMSLGVFCHGGAEWLHIVFSLFFGNAGLG